MTTRALTDDEISILVFTLRQRSKFRDALLLLLAVDTGYRASELLSIEWPQLLSPTGEIRRDLTVERVNLKGGAGARRKVVRSRRVPLTDRVRSAIADYLGLRQALPQGPVFKARTGDNKSISREIAHRMLKSLARELGIDASRIGCHSTRKSFAVRVHRAGQYDLVKTQRLLNHSSPLTTAKYLETTQDELDNLVLALDTTFVSAPTTCPAAISQ